MRSSRSPAMPQLHQRRTVTVSPDAVSPQTISGSPRRFAVRGGAQRGLDPTRTRAQPVKDQAHTPRAYPRTRSRRSGAPARQSSTMGQVKVRVTPSLSCRPEPALDAPWTLLDGSWRKVIVDLLGCDCDCWRPPGGPGPHRWSALG